MLRATRYRSRVPNPDYPVILVVEESPVRLNNLRETLQGADFVVLPAANARQGLELAESCAGPIQLLITQLHPADMLGPELARRLRARSPEMNVLYTSANPLAVLEIPDPDEVVSCMLPRPLSKEILLSRVHTLLATHA
jgi:DNA-binding response OmpR family regulator